MGYTRLCPRRGGPQGTEHHLWSHSLGRGDKGCWIQEPRTCRYELGEGHEMSRDAQLHHGGAARTPTPACTAAAECCFAFATRAEASSSFRSRVEIPQRRQRRGLRSPANLPWTQPGVGTLPSRCSAAAAASLGKDNLEQRGRWEPSWGCTCPLAAAGPRLAACVSPSVVGLFFSGSPALI